MKKLSSKVVLLVVVVIAGISISWVNFRPQPEPPSDLFEIKKNLDIFYDVYNKVEGMYVDEVQPGTLMKTGIDAMLKSLDPYTVYIPESKIEDLRFMTTGSYGGIGALIRKSGDDVIIAEPYEGYPAHEVGLKAGDVIIAVDGKSVEGMAQSRVSEVLKGEPDTEVKLTVKREGTSGTIEKTLSRKKVKIPDVPYYGMVDEKTGYAKLNSFTTTSSSEVISAFQELQDQGMEQFVLDLRGNGGGLLIEAVKIVNMFVEKGQEVVKMKGKLQNTNKTYQTRAKALDTDIPVAVLVDDGSASASEIVSGSLQDLDRAIIVGTRTFGKGLVQQTHDLKYNGKIKITIAKYYTPSGRCIQKIDYFGENQGNASKVPDSLLSKFKTQNGREVMDGRGIEPDVKIEPPVASDLTAALVTNHIIFNFASKFARQHDSIQSVADFSLADSDFKAFKAFALEQDFEYSNQSLDELKRLRKEIEEEKYLDETSGELDALEKKLTPNKSSDLERYREEITQILENEIVSRYYYQNGRVENALKHDIFLQQAIKVLNDRSQYNGILNP